MAEVSPTLPIGKPFEFKRKPRSSPSAAGQVRCTWQPATHARLASGGQRGRGRDGWLTRAFPLEAAHSQWLHAGPHARLTSGGQHARESWFMRALPLEAARPQRLHARLASGGQDGRDSWLTNTRALPLQVINPQWLHPAPRLKKYGKGHVIETCFCFFSCAQVVSSASKICTLTGFNVSSSQHVVLGVSLASLYQYLAPPVAICRHELRLSSYIYIE